MLTVLSAPIAKGRRKMKIEVPNPLMFGRMRQQNIYRNFCRCLGFLSSTQFYFLAALIVAQPVGADSVKAENELEVVTKLLFGNLRAQNNPDELWKWARNRPMNFLAVTKGDEVARMKFLDRSENPEVEMIARTLLKARDQLMRHVDIGYGMPGNMVIFFHNDLDDAMARLSQIFEDGKDKITAWPKWNAIRERMEDKAKRNCIYRISYHEGEIYGGYVLISSEQPEPSKIRCLKAALLLALGAKHISPESMGDRFDTTFELLAKIYRENIPPGIPRDDFKLRWKN